MLEKRRTLGDLHARMRAVQGGLFRAEYSGRSIQSRGMHGTFPTITSAQVRKT